MKPDVEAMMNISGHYLLIKNPEVSLDFYQSKLGMSLVARHQDGQKRYYVLSFGGEKEARLVLVHDNSLPEFQVVDQPDPREGYWKFSIAVVDLELARQRLISGGIRVGSAFEVQDVAFLCHFTDPDGYCIELIQHHFQANKPEIAPCDRYLMGSQPVLNLSTLRVKDIQKSLEFYESLGMTLVSRQSVGSRGMTLYFLSFGQEQPPSNQVDDLCIREWLWQRPYTLLELQHIHGTEKNEEFSYRVGAETGFLGLTIQTNDSQPPVSDCQCVTVQGIVPARKIADPDGHTLYLV